LAAKKATAEEITKLQNQLKKMKRYTDARDLGRLIESNTEFHMMIHDIGKNYYIKQLINILRTFDASLRRRSLEDYQESLRGFNEHKGVFEAIASGDEALAEEKMKQHIIRTSAHTRTKSKPDSSPIAENTNPHAETPQPKALT
jgi:DNA-binding GntR family transcriptional regulator